MTTLVERIDSVGALIRARRQQRGWSQADLAEATGFTTSYISRVERGDVGVPSQPNLQRFGDALGIALGEFYQAAGRLAGLDLPAPAPSSRLEQLILALGQQRPAFNAQLDAVVDDVGEAEWTRTVLPKIAQQLADQGSGIIELVRLLYQRVD